MSGRVLRRPLGGWHARLWRREVARWLALASFVVGSWGALNLAVATLNLLN